MSKHKRLHSNSEKEKCIDDRIRDRAYELYLERLSVERDMDEGNAEEDWLRAEKEIMESTQSPGKAA
jgi:hypothetical protein